MTGRRQLLSRFAFERGTPDTTVSAHCRAAEGTVGREAILDVNAYNRGRGVVNVCEDTAPLAAKTVLSARRRPRSRRVGSKRRGQQVLHHGSYGRRDDSELPQSAAIATASSAVNRSTTVCLDVLYMGMRGETVTDVSQRLLAHHGGLRGLFRLDVAELARIRGLGDAKAVRLKAALELGRRLGRALPGGAAPGRLTGGRGQSPRHRDGGVGARAVAGGAARYQAPHPGHAHGLSRQRQPGPGAAG